jgi:hypothetical protein
MKYFKYILPVLFFILISSYAHSDTSFYFFGKGNFFSSSGNSDDYEAGVNDFPLAAGHSTYGFGAGLTSGSGAAFFGLEAHYNLKGSVTLTDPSDDDTVDIDTYQNLTGLFILGFNIIKTSSVRFFVNGGGGVSMTIGAEDAVYESSRGFETEINVPDKKYPLTFFGGAGAVLKFSPSVGVIIMGRYQYISLDQPQSAIAAMAGLCFDF